MCQWELPWQQLNSQTQTDLGTQTASNKAPTPTHKIKKSKENKNRFGLHKKCHQGRRRKKRKKKKKWNSHANTKLLLFVNTPPPCCLLNWPNTDI